MAERAAGRARETEVVQRLEREQGGPLCGVYQPPPLPDDSFGKGQQDIYVGYFLTLGDREDGYASLVIVVEVKGHEKLYVQCWLTDVISWRVSRNTPTRSS